MNKNQSTDAEPLCSVVSALARLIDALRQGLPAQAEMLGQISEGCREILLSEQDPKRLRELETKAQTNDSEPVCSVASTLAVLMDALRQGPPAQADMLEQIAAGCREILSSEFDQQSYQQERKRLRELEAKTHTKVRSYRVTGSEPLQGLSRLNLGQLSKVKNNLDNFWNHANQHKERHGSQEV